jgi:uncharacterized protein YjbI with pentapeptide repeats
VDPRFLLEVLVAGGIALLIYLATQSLEMKLLEQQLNQNIQLADAQQRQADRLADSQQNAADVTFVREVAMSRSELKPFAGLNLKNADFSLLDLSCEWTSYATCAYFYESDLRSTTFDMSQMTGASFSNSDLRNSNLSGFFDHARFDETDLRGADLSAGSFLDATFFEVCYDGTTKFSESGRPDEAPVCR